MEVSDGRFFEGLDELLEKKDSQGISLNDSKEFKATLMKDGGIKFPKRPMLEKKDVKFVAWTEHKNGMYF